MNERVDKTEDMAKDFISGVWSERVLVVTKDFYIEGYVFMPKTAKKNRVLSEILNSQKRFIAIKNCKLTYRNNTNKISEYSDFIQLNLDSIILLKQLKEKTPIRV